MIIFAIDVGTDISKRILEVAVNTNPGICRFKGPISL